MKAPADLQSVEDEIPEVLFDIRYATNDNFTGTRLYNEPIVWLRKEAAVALKGVAEEIKNLGYKLVIFDGFRPVGVQEKLREHFHDDNYVKEFSNHCKGIAVDLTLADMDGNLFDMGSEYDDFSEKSFAYYEELNPMQLTRRTLLRQSMEKAGFKVHYYEWWHFDYMPDKDWDVIEDEQNTFKLK